MRPEDIGSDGFPPTPENIAKLTAASLERDRRSLHGSARINDIGRVRELLAEGADVNGADEYGHAPLMWAAAYGRVEILRLLIERGADVSLRSSSAADALYHAVICGHPDTVITLLEAGVDVNARMLKEPPSGDRTGHTALHAAIRHRHDEVVRALVMHGADVNVRDEDGHTPWSLAAKGRRYSAIREMLETAGAREE